MLQINGRVINQETQEPISFANIAICGKAYGTSSNEEGFFRISIPQEYQGDSLCISCLGYGIAKFALGNVPEKIIWVVPLTPNVIDLEQVVILDYPIPAADKAIRKAIQKIPKNYPNRPFLLEGYYRDYLQNDSGNHHIVEAAIGIYDRGFANQDAYSRVKIYQSRNSRGFPLNYGELYENNLGGTSGNLNIVGGNQLSIIRYNNPVRNYNRNFDLKTGYELDEEFILSHNFTFESVSFADEAEKEPIYCFSMFANNHHRHFRKLAATREDPSTYELKGKIYIRAKDFAIIRLDYSTSKFINQQKKKLNELHLEYQEYQGKMYLDYISFCNYIRIPGDLKTDEFLHFRELFVNKVRSKNLPPPDSFYLFSKIQQIYDQNKLADPSFWEEYNMVLQKSD